MAKSYPRRDAASGIWTLSDITSNIINYGTWPISGSGVRGLVCGGKNPSISDVIDYFTISTTGDGQLKILQLRISSVIIYI